MSTALFYKELGKLLYAMALADKTITKEEKEEVSKQIAERLLHKEVDADQFGSNEAWITQFSFDTTEEVGGSGEEAFEEFLTFIKQYRNELTEQEIEICYRLSEHVANAYRHVNKNENKMLTSLRNYLMGLHTAQLIF
jgi:hypothetical protein